MVAKAETWCDRDEHKLFELFADFNEWIESDDGSELREENKIDGLSQPSKAFFASDKKAYDQVFRGYRKERRHEVLNERYLCEQFMGDHWFTRNLNRFEQLIQCMEAGSVVPFVGAGLSVAGGFPSWKNHLRQQGKTAGINPIHVETLLASGQYESIIEEIEAIRGMDVFTQEIRDVFSVTGNITDATLLLTELFPDTLITTNYDRLIEQAFDTGEKNAFQVINGINALEEPDPTKVSIIKLHGDIKSAKKCILSKKQYDDAYGPHVLDMARPIPKLLAYYFRNSSLLFLGCSLSEDRTMQVFRSVKDEIGDEELPQHFSIEQAPEDEQVLVARNAHLAKLGITAIWFEKGRFDCVEGMLRLAKNELRYRGVIPGAQRVAIENESIIKTDELSLFKRLIKRLGF
jgi:NAD-dependent SIR2 family protein deacetylase